jgi:hypothetical protein
MRNTRASSRKFFNRPTEDGFDSRKEQRVFRELELLYHASEPRLRVANVARQVAYEVVPAQYDERGRCIERAVHYIADFVVDYGDGRREVLDAKSAFTRKLPVYVIKRKLMLWRYGLRVRER